MKIRILYILDSLNIFGGTPRKTLELMNYFNTNSYLYVYSNSFNQYYELFQKTKGKVIIGPYGRNIFRHVKSILQIIKENEINIIQTQFFFGILLATIVKIIKPKLVLVVAFVGLEKYNFFKEKILQLAIPKSDHIVFVSNFIKKSITQKFKAIEKMNYSIILNGYANNLQIKQEIPREIKHIAIFDSAALIELKNLQVVIKALLVLKNKFNYNNFYFYVCGNGPYKANLDKLIEKFHLQNYVFFLGYCEDVYKIISKIDIFVHPAYAEGFGIAVVEAMLAEKPIIVSNAGALPELIENNISGLVVDPHDPEEWAEAIIKLVKNTEFAKELAMNAKRRAEELFSIKRFCNDYEKLYLTLLQH